VSHRSIIPVVVYSFLATRACLKRSVAAFQRRRSEILFAGLILFTSAVSVHDAALVILLDDVIGETEQNPIGRWLIELNGGEVWLFIALKLTGTALCGATLWALYEVCRHVARTAAIAIACFQFALLIYLSSR
jgi:hypothetical protein